MSRQYEELIKTPFGWKFNSAGNEIPHRYEQELINIVRDYRKRGFTFRLIAKELTKASDGHLIFLEKVVVHIYNAETTQERKQRFKAGK